MRRSRNTKSCPTRSFSLTTNCLAIRTTLMGSGITPTANPLPKRLMAPRSSLQVRAGGTQRQTPPRAVVTIPSRAPRERKAQGSWRVTDFRSFEQLSGWWGLGPNFKEKGWQGPPGSSSFSGFLTLKVSLENQGDATLVAWV